MSARLLEDFKPERLLLYTYRVQWSPEDNEYVGLVAEFPSLSWLDPDPVLAGEGIRKLVVGVVDDMAQRI